jgi:hypothetical protein
MVEDEVEVEEEDEGAEVEKPLEVDWEGEDESEEESDGRRTSKQSRGKCLPASTIRIEGRENVSHHLVI